LHCVSTRSNPIAATAILDRFLEHSELITITDKSYRLRQKAERKPEDPEKGKATGGPKNSCREPKA